MGTGLEQTVWKGKGRGMKAAGGAMLALLISLALAFPLAACARGDDALASTFPHIDDADIPDVLETTVGTLGDTYYSAYSKWEGNGYRSYLAVTFKGTTGDDYSALLEHYRSAATGTDEEGFLLFDWGRLQATAGDGSIFVEAFMK